MPVSGAEDSSVPGADLDSASSWDASRDGGILMDPPADRWRGLVDACWGDHRGNSGAIRTRAELGLSPNRPVIASGHQATVWHPGILAKWLAMEASAERVGAGTCWVVVDQDTEDATALAYPVRTPAGVWARERWRWMPALSPEVPAGASAAASPAAVPSVEMMSEGVSAGLRRVRGALANASGKGSLAEQVTAATVEMLREVVSAPAMVYASRLCRTSRFIELVDSMSREPEACVLAYNRAVRANPQSGLRELVADVVNDRWELPLWRIRAGMPRARVYAEDLPGVPREELAPRAILMTGLLRADACELFIHGLGGGLYDPACEAWMKEWQPGLRLAPTVVVSATLLLPLESAAAASDGRVAHLAWRMHHARHNPKELGDKELQEAKEHLLGVIRGSPRRSADRRDAFDRVHEVLEHARAAHGVALGGMTRDLDAARLSRSHANVASARDWPFPLYSEVVLREMRRRIWERFGSA